MKRTIAWLVAVGLAGAVAARAPRIGEPAPPFQLTTVDGRTVRSEELRGQVVVLNFWATWCVPCRAELPLLDTYYAVQQPHGLAAFAVTTEDSVPLSSMKKLFAAMKMPSARSFRGPYQPIGGAVPSNYVIDRAGVVRYARAGAFDLETLNAVLVPLLQEPKPAVVAAR